MNNSYRPFTHTHIYIYTHDYEDRYIQMMNMKATNDKSKNKLFTYMSKLYIHCKIQDKVQSSRITFSTPPPVLLLQPTPSMTELLGHTRLAPNVLLLLRSLPSTFSPVYVLSRLRPLPSTSKTRFPLSSLRSSSRVLSPPVSKTRWAPNIHGRCPAQ